MPVEARLQKVETAIAVLTTDLTGLKTDVGSIAAAQHAFVDEWRASKQSEADRAAKAYAASRLTLPQIVGMIGVAVTTTAVIIGGGLALMRTESGAVELRLSARIEAEAAKTALSLRSTQDALTGAQAQIGTLGRDFGQAAVQIGLIGQTAQRNAADLAQVSKIDIDVARLEERVRALAERRPPP